MATEVFHNFQIITITITISHGSLEAPVLGYFMPKLDIHVSNSDITLPTWT